jgi:V8-like Glu-specific endopeptidase
MTFLTSNYSSVVYLTTDFGQGSGVIIGKHTILTASHLVWSADQNRSTGGFKVSAGTAASAGSINLSVDDGGATLHYKKVGNAGGLISISASQSDYAVISVSADLSAYGAMTLSDRFTGGYVHVTGFPGTARGVQTDNTALAQTNSYYEVLSVFDPDITHGNSGGPVWTSVGGVQTVVGVISAGSGGTATAARISTTSQAEITGWLNEANDRYREPVAAPVIGRPSQNTGFSNYFGSNASETITGSTRNDFIHASFGNDVIDGKSGFDQVIYSAVAISDVMVNVAGATTTVTKVKQGGRDQLTGVERIQFADGILAFDASGDLGQAYRLYQAAFNRTPDRGGLSYWVKQLDNNASLAQVAGGFVGSQEFQNLYRGSTASRTMIETFYRNVLGREGEASGISFWETAIAGGQTTAQVLVGFSESAENVTRLSGVLSTGITLDLI